MGSVVVILSCIAESILYYNAWNFHEKTLLNLGQGSLGYTYIGECKDETCFNIVFPEAVCYCWVEDNHIIAINNLIKVEDESEVRTEQIGFGIYDYINKKKRDLNREDFFLFVKNNFPKTYKDLINIDKDNFLCARYTYMPDLKECEIY